MTRFPFIFAVLIFFGGFARAHTPQMRPSQMWKIERDGKVSYLLGSMHRGVSAEQLPAPLLKIIDSASRVFFEADFSQMNAMFQPAPSKPGPPPEKVPLSSLLSKSAFEKLKVELASRFAEAGLDSLTPTFAAWALAVVRDERMAQVPEIVELAKKVPAGMLDLELYVKAKQKNQSLGFLEEVQVARDLLSSVSVTAADLEADALLSEEQIRAQKVKPIQDLISAAESYVRGDVEGTLKLLGEVSPDNPEQNATLTDRFLSGRNLAWLPKIEAAHAEGVTVFVVGASHILGKDNLIQLLQARGYKIDRVMVPAGCQSDLLPN